MEAAGRNYAFFVRGKFNPRVILAFGLHYRLSSSHSFFHEVASNPMPRRDFHKLRFLFTAESLAFRTAWMKLAPGREVQWAGDHSRNRVKRLFPRASRLVSKFRTRLEQT